MRRTGRPSGYHTYRATPVLAAVAAVAAIALLAGCSTTPADPAAQAAASARPSTPAPTPSAPPPPAPEGSRCPPGTPEEPEGPREQAVVAAEASDSSPRISMVRYPRPDTDGNPWSHWGQGLALDDGRMLSAIGNHLGEDGNSYLYVYDPGTESLTQFNDVVSQLDGQPSWGYGKVHGQIVAGDCGEAFFSTYWGTRNGLTYTDTYQGDELFRIDTESLDLEPLGAVMPQRGVPSLAGAPDQGLIFGEAVDPLADNTDGDQGDMFVYDTREQTVVFASDTAQHIGYRNVMVDGQGVAYFAGRDGSLLTYTPGAEELEEHPQRLPGGGWLRASTHPARDGTVYGATRDPEVLFALETDGSINDLGPAQGYTTSMAVEPDGSVFYYVPGAHGGAAELGTPLVAVDTATGEQTTVARLGDLASSTLGLYPSGSYSVVLDEVNRRLFVTLNAGTDPEEQWGEVMLAIVDLPGSDATTTQAVSTTCSSTDDAWSSVYQAAAAGSSGPLQLEDSTDAWGAAEPLTGMRGHAVATADVNGDGWSDVFVGTFADRPDEDYEVRGAEGPSPDRLLLGGPDGFRVDDSFPTEFGRTSGAAFADLDADGDPDLVVARNVRDSDRGRAPTTVLRNDDGRFTQVGTLAQPAAARSVGVLDYDADGRLDLFIAEDRFAGGSSRLLRNSGEFAFDDVTAQAGLPADVHGLGVGAGDLNGDAAPDLLVGGSNRLFINDGDGTFSEQPAALPEWPTFGDEDDPAGVALGDLNADGRPDVVIGQHHNSTLDDGQLAPVRLYLNEPGGPNGVQLVEVTDDAGLVGLPTKSPHVEIADIDSDGRPDIVTTAAGEDGRPIVFRQIDAGGQSPRFEASSAPGPAQYWVTGSVVDFDRDGRQDYVAVEWEPARPTQFWRNTGDTGHWLSVSAPPGSDIAVYEAGRLDEMDGRLGTGAVGSSTGYAASPHDEAWFGLGSVGAVDVSVTLPGESPVVATSVAADQSLHLCGP